MAKSKQDYFNEGAEAARHPLATDAMPAFGKGSSWQARAFAMGFTQQVENLKAAQVLPKIPRTPRPGLIHSKQKRQERYSATQKQRGREAASEHVRALVRTVATLRQASMAPGTLGRLMANKFRILRIESKIQALRAKHNI